jgi:hypothetical protein
MKNLLTSYRQEKGLLFARWKAARRPSEKREIYSHICEYTMGRSLSGVTSLTVA